MGLSPKVRLAQSRLAAAKRWPFATSSILSLVPVETDRVPTAAVDEWWRLYWNPEFISKCKPDEAAAVICHEVSHLLLKHAARAKGMVPAEPGPRMIWNWATDCAINEQLRKEGISLPPGDWCYPEKFQLEAGKAAEVYYRELMDRTEFVTVNVTVQLIGGGSCSDGVQRPWEAGSPEDEEETKPHHPEGMQDGESGDSGSDGADRESESKGSQARASTPPGIPAHEQDQLIREAAQKFKASQQRGTQRGNSMFGKWADDILHPKVDPRVLLMRAVRHSLQQTSGGCDEWTFRRPSRRQSQGGLLRPAPVTVVPRVAILIDTSGSMGQRDLSLAVGLVAKVLSGLRLRDGIQVYAGDTGVHVATKVFGPRDVVLAGGGGTDVGAMLEEVYEKSKAKPDVMLAITDGITPWPDKPLPCRVVACITRDESEKSYYGSSYQVPSWIHSVVLNP